MSINTNGRFYWCYKIIFDSKIVAKHSQKSTEVWSSNKHRGDHSCISKKTQVQNPPNVVKEANCEFWVILIVYVCPYNTTNWPKGFYGIYFSEKNTHKPNICKNGKIET